MQRRHMAVAAIVAASVIGLGGAGIAAAQSDDGSSPTVTTPGSTPGSSPSSEAPGGSMAGGCQHGGGGAGTPGEAPTAPPNQPSGTADAAAA